MLNEFTLPLWAEILLYILLVAILAEGVKRLMRAAIGAKGILPRLQNVLQVIVTPTYCFIWLFGLLIIVEYLLGRTSWSESCFALSRARQLSVASYIVWLIFAAKEQLQKQWEKRVESHANKKQELLLITTVGKMGTVAILAIFVMVILDIFEVQLTAILALSGIGGLAVGFAGKDIIANFFGGLMIHLNRPFFIGERITSLNRNFDGFVQEIGWYSTCIQTVNQRPAYIPNALFIDAIIENWGRMTNRRIAQKIGIRYEDIPQIEPIVKSLREYIETHPGVDHSKRRLVHFIEFGPYSVNIELVCFSRSTDVAEWKEVQQEIFLKVVEILAQHKAEFAYPTQTIHFSPKGTP